MSACTDAAKDVPHRAALVDDESRAHYAASRYFAIHLLVLKHAVLLAHFAFDVRQQLHIEAVFVAESSMAHAIVHAHPQHYGVEIEKFILKIAEVDGFQRAPRRVILRIKIQHYVIDT